MARKPTTHDVFNVVAEPRRRQVLETIDAEELSVMEKVAHTLAYDGMIMGDTMSGKPLPSKKWFSNTAPTLVITGGNSEAFFHKGAKALVNDLPNAQHRILEGQDHAVSPAALAPVLIEFFLA